MALSRTKLIVHPVRLRLLAALARRELTARQVSAVLPDIPPATLYYHLGLLTRAGLLRVVSERRVRGTVEKRYALAEDSMLLSPDELANASRDDHLRYFTLFVTTLLGDFARYLEQEEPIDFVADGVSYRETPFYLSDDEFARAVEAFNRALLPFFTQPPAPDRRRRLFAMITLPDAEPSADTMRDAERPRHLSEE